MTRIATILLLVVLAALGGRLAAGTGGGTPAKQRARVVEVIDGDTVKVRVGARRETVRMIGIDTPELHRPGTPVECGARAARRALVRLAMTPDGRGRSVVLVSDPTQDRRDRYDRLLAYVDLVAGGRDLGEAVVREGWADVYVYGGVPFDRAGRYRRAAREAREAGRGVWRSCAGKFHG